MGKKTLLVLNGNETLLGFAEKMFMRAEYSVLCAKGVSAAKEQLASHSPDCVIIDSGTADGNAFDFCRELRETGGAPVLFVSSDRDNELPALRAGADDFLKSPYDRDVIKARINNLIGKKNARPGGDSDRAVPEKPANAGVRTKSRKRLYAVIPACLLLAAAVIAVSYALGGGARDIPDDRAPLASSPFEETPDRLFPYYESFIVSAENPFMGMTLRNPEDSGSHFTFEVVLENSGEVLYSSGPADPGTRIDGFALNRALPISEYRAVLVIRAYEIGSLKQTGSVTVAFDILAI